MRAFEPSLWQLGEVSIAEVGLDPGSRDDISQLLRRLQHLYITPTLREEVQRGEETLAMLPKGAEGTPLAVVVGIERFLVHTKRQIDQIGRRVLLCETILQVSV